MNARTALAGLAVTLSACYTAPDPVGSVEVRAMVCAGLVCVNVEKNVRVTLRGGKSTVSETMEAETVRFDHVTVGTYTVTATYIGPDRCWFEFGQETVTVVENETAKVLVNGTGGC